MAIGSATLAGKPPSIQSTRALRAVIINNLNLERKNQQAIASNPRRNRLSIGLSLAEALILVLFLALVVLGLRLAHIQKQASNAQLAYEALQANLPALQPLIERIQKNRQSQTEAVEEIVVKLARALGTESATANLARENSELRAQLVTYRAGLSGSREGSDAPPDVARVAQASSDEPIDAVSTPSATELSVLELSGSKSDTDPVLVVAIDDVSKSKGRPLESESARLGPQVSDGGGLAGSNHAHKKAHASAIAGAKGAATARRIERRAECDNRWRVGGAEGRISIWCP
jgi:Tfp pilus assembly protein PilV